MIYNQAHTKRTTKFVNARYFILTSQQNMINEKYENQPCAARTLCPVLETALCYGNLVLQRPIRLQKLMDHFSVLDRHTDTKKHTLERICHSEKPTVPKEMRNSA